MTCTMPGEGGMIPRLDDRYELGNLIGEGAVGRVYEAFDTVLGIDVAVKLMHPQHTRSKELVERFAREASLASRMLSPHVVKVLGLAVAQSGAPAIVYERLEGESLANRLERTGPLSLAETIDVVKQTARALARAHAVGVVHRDVKPDNIFLVTEPHGRTLVKLLDFGISEIADPSKTATLVGTPEYIAPEILFGTAGADARTDLYALGVVAFECLTGRCPFPGETIDDVLLQVRYGTRATLADLRPDLGPEIDEWVERALQPDPFWRFASAKSMSDALDEVARASVPARSLRRAS